MRSNSVGRWMFAVVSILAISVSTSRAQSVDAQLVGSAENMQAFLLKDLNIDNPEQNPVLFTMTVTAGAAGNYRLAMQLSKLDEPNSGNLLSSFAITKAFAMTNGESFTITNRQFGANVTKDLKISRPVPELNNSAKDLVRKTVGAGKLPSGRYKFDLRLISDPIVGGNQDPTPLAFDELILEISNPSNLELFSPGAPASGMEIPEIATDAPLMQWRSDARSFVLKVVDRRCTNSSPEEALNNTPYLHIRINNSQSFPYPKDAVIPAGGGIRELSPTRPLQKGKTYYWTVRAIVPTSGGDVELPSEIYAFRVSSGMEDPNVQNIKSALELVLGNQTRELIQLLDCYRPSGEVRINGQTATLDELRALGAKFGNGELKIKSISVE